MTQKKGSRSSAVLLGMLVILIGMVGLLFVEPDKVADVDRFAFYKSRADSLFKLGDYEESLVHYKSALTYKPSDKYIIAQIKEAESFKKSGVFQQYFGGEEHDYFADHIQTDDGGFLLAGNTRSFSKGEEDIWLVKTDRFGVLDWRRTFGGKEKDLAYKIIEAHGGDYLILGSTYSSGAGNGDVWLLRINNKGRKVWEETIGNQFRNIAVDIVKGLDESYVLAGHTEVVDSLGNVNMDLWMVKTNFRGKPIWEQTFGGEKQDAAAAVVANSDGSYTFAGYHHSFSEAGDSDGIAICLNSDGEELWKRSYGGPDTDIITSIIATEEGGYLCTGSSKSFSNGKEDVWLVKTTADGRESWKKLIGGKDSEMGKGLVNLPNGDYAIVGYTESYGAGDRDAWLLVTDANGKLRWKQEYGNHLSQDANSVVKTEDGYVLSGFTTPEQGNTDAWILKTDEEGKTMTIQ